MVNIELSGQQQLYDHAQGRVLPEFIIRPSSCKELLYGPVGMSYTTLMHA